MKAKILVFFGVAFLNACAMVGSYEQVTDVELEKSVNSYASSDKFSLNSEMENLAAGKAISTSRFGIRPRRNNATTMSCEIKRFDEGKVNIKCKDGTHSSNGSYVGLGSHDHVIDLCPASFEQKPQLPHMAYWFFVSGISFQGDRDSAIAFYGMLKSYCED